MKEDHEFELLVVSSAQGDAESFRKLYEGTIDRIYAYLRTRVSSDEEAGDIAHDVFVQLFRALPGFQYRSRAEFFAFLFTIVRRSLARLYTEHKKASEHVEAHIDPDTLPGQMHEAGVRMDVARALETLDAQTREIVLLHHFSGYSFVEIAPLMQMTESAVRVRHHRALKLLQTTLTRV